MFIFLIVIHVIVSIALILIVLIQSGRGGGLTEGFQRAEVLFGAKTNVFLTRATAVLAVIFFFTCLGLAFLSAKQGQSLMENMKSDTPTEQTAPISVMPKQLSQESPKTEEKIADTQAQLPKRIEEQELPKPEQTEEIPKTE